MDDLERMKAVLTIVHGLETLTPEDRERWREQCLEQLTDEASRNFVNLAADYVKKEVETCGS